MYRLDGQRVLVTGVTGGIGRAVAETLKSAGAELVISGRDKTKLAAGAEALGGVPAVSADLTDEAQVASLMDEAGAALGGIDTLVNVPGLSIPAPIAEMALEDFAKVMDANVTSVFLASKHFVQAADPDKGGLIISVSSVAGKNANPNAPVYCAAKAAMNMLSSGLAMQVKKANVKVSVVSPGAVTTPGFWGDRPVPHEKFLKPEEVAEVVAFVANLPANVVLHDVVFEPWAMYRSK
ncbi:MAG: SDR family oxidoreductase [Planctomycetota bacterium]